MLTCDYAICLCRKRKMEKGFGMHCHTNYLTHNSSHYDTCIHSKQFFKDRTSKNDHAPWFKWTLSVVSLPNLMLFCQKPVITLRHRQNGRYFTDDTFKCILMKILKFRLNFHLSFSQVPINNIIALVQIMVCRRAGHKPLSDFLPLFNVFTFNYYQTHRIVYTCSPKKSDRLSSNTVGCCRTQLT